MSVNQLTVNQAATVFNDIVHQATGQTNLKVTDTSSFVSAATTVLLTGYDKLLTAMSQVLTRTILALDHITLNLRDLERGLNGSAIIRVK